MSLFRIAAIGSFKNPLYLNALFYFRAQVHDPLLALQDLIVATPRHCFQGFVWSRCRRFLRANFARQPRLMAYALIIACRQQVDQKKFRWK
jgi:hypothetical protein